MYFVVRFIIKTVRFCFEYFRGSLFFLEVIACGGKCSAVPRIQRGLVFKYPPHKGITIGKRCFIGPNCIFDVPIYAQLSIGDNVRFTNSAVIASNRTVTIGDNCLIAEFVSIRDAEHGFSSVSLINQQALTSKGIHIESDVWLGRSSSVFLGSQIKKGCIIGANSIVKNVSTDPYGVYVGVPAKKIKSRE